jgi:hypothetical protein
MVKNDRDPPLFTSKQLIKFLKDTGSLSFLVGTISNVLVMEIGWTDVRSARYILGTCVTVILVDTAGIVDHHRLYKLSLHNVTILSI